jgi:hypothetical protein
MAKKIMTTLGALLALTICGCDGPVEHDIDCAKICDEAGDCVGGNFDKTACRKDCRQDASQDDADKCQQCLTNQDSCSEDTKCAVECSGVGLALVFK